MPQRFECTNQCDGKRGHQGGGIAIIFPLSWQASYPCPPVPLESAVSVRPIIRFPDPLLRSPSTAVTAFDDNLRMLVDDLLDTMRAAPGVGITGPHIGVLKRVVVIELSREDGVRIYINPEILWSSAETTRHTEGSVSMPGATEEIVRPKSIRFRYLDIAGETHEAEAYDFLAICIQHEIDQLDGIFWLQRLSKLKRDRLVKKWEKMRD